MSSDPPIPGRQDEERISRRDLGRYAALSAVAATITGKAAAQHETVSAGPFVKAADTMSGTTGCKLFLNLLPRGTTVFDLLYGDFHKVLDGLADSAGDPMHPNHNPTLANGLKTFSDSIKTVNGGKNLGAWLFYAHDEENPPPNSPWDKPKWKAAHGSQNGASQKAIADHFRFPFLNLGKNSTDPLKKGQREIISSFMQMKDPWDHTKYYVHSRIGHIKYHDIFEKPRNHPDVCGAMCQAPDKDDPAWTKFRLIRRAFHHGIFADMAAMSGTHRMMEDNLMMIEPNNLCYSETEQDCIEMYNGFCWTIAGSPGAGSTFCE